MDAIRIGFVGLGGICRERHVPGLKKLPGVEIVAVANRSRASSEAAAREFTIPVICDDWREIIQRDDINTVFVGTWPYMHHPVSIAALEAGKHVFCQARMAMNFTEAREMYEAAVHSGRVAALCPVPYGLSVDRTIQRFLSEGVLGKVHLVRVQSTSGVNIDEDAPLHWRKDHRLSGLNTLTLGMFIEIIHRWFGWTKTVTAQTQIYTPWRRDAEGRMVEIKIPDQVLFNADMEQGVVVQYVFSGMTAHGKDTIEIHGTHASLCYDAGPDILYFLRENNQLEPVAILPEDVYDVHHWSVERDFIEAIRSDSPYHPNFEDGMRYMQVIKAVYDSAKRQRTVHLEGHSQT
ncbi:MAG TPA: Gfo/Idh/MocA family oxidoreductase [Candidatus Hydrogenedentes bacterium]|nr:Gfo/Idh/MocA family oxidoreductase [Candidatus Hydrogenedentota bacterium]